MASDAAVSSSASGRVGRTHGPRVPAKRACFFCCWRPRVGYQIGGGVSRTGLSNPPPVAPPFAATLARQIACCGAQQSRGKQSRAARFWCCADIARVCNRQPSKCALFGCLRVFRPCQPCHAPRPACLCAGWHDPAKPSTACCQRAGLRICGNYNLQQSVNQRPALAFFIG